MPPWKHFIAILRPKGIPKELLQSDGVNISTGNENAKDYKSQQHPDQDQPLQAEVPPLMGDSKYAQDAGSQLMNTTASFGLTFIAVKYETETTTETYSTLAVVTTIVFQSECCDDGNWLF
jgi:hypothetical protein